MLRLNEHFRFGFLDELIARKTAEEALAENLDWAFHQAKLGGLAIQLDRAFEDSELPEERDRWAIHEFLVRLRLGKHD